MSGLADAARDARARADTSLDPADHMVANALEAALDAAARECVNELRDEPDTTGIPTPNEAGFVADIQIPKTPHPPGSPEWWTSRHDASGA